MDALWANQINQTFTRQAYIVSGGAASPGTSSTQVEVDIAQVDARIDGSAVSHAGASVPLSDGGSKPRVDVVYLQSDATLQVAQGVEADYRPNEDANGNSITPEPHEHWAPSPDDGTNVTGVPLVAVLVEAGWTDSTSMTTDHLQDRRMSAADDSEFVSGDGGENGATTITVNDADFAVQDTTDATAEYLWRDHSAGVLYLGSPDATPTLRANLDANGNTVTGIEQATFADATGAALDLTADSNGRKNIWRHTDAASTATEYIGLSDPAGNRPKGPTGFAVSEVGGDDLFNVDTGGTIHTPMSGGGLALEGGGITGLGDGIKVVSGSGALFDLRPNSDGDQILWRHDDGTSAPTEYFVQSQPSSGNLLRGRDMTNSTNVFKIGTDGTGTLGEEQIATQPWASGQFLPSGGGTMSGNLDLGDNDIIGPNNLEFQRPGTGGKQNIRYFSGTTTLTVFNTNTSTTVFSFNDVTASANYGIEFDNRSSGAVPNRTLFNNGGTLSYKDGSGTVHALY